LFQLFGSFATNQRGGGTVNRILRIVGVVALIAFACGCEKEFGANGVLPGSGILTGGETVTISGGGFRRDVGMTVYFGTMKADNVMVRSAEAIVVTTPPAKVESKVDIRIITDDGKELLLKQAFQYLNKGAPAAKELESLDQRKNLRE
jgi:hypothetical protein